MAIVVNSLNNQNILNVDPYTPQKLEGSPFTAKDLGVFDATIQRVSELNLKMLTELNNAGLVADVGGLEVLSSSYLKSSQVTKGTSNMEGLSSADKDLIVFERGTTPHPLHYKELVVPKRYVMAFETAHNTLTGAGINLINEYVYEAAEAVTHDIEYEILHGSNVTFEGNKIYGFLNFPQRGKVTLTGNGWVDADGSDYLGDTLKVVKDLGGKGYGGENEIMIFVSFDTFQDLQRDYSEVKGDNTYQERIEAITAISTVRPLSELPSGNVLFVSMRPKVVDYGLCMDLTTYIKAPEGGDMEYKVKVLQAGSPRFKADIKSQCGYVHGSN